MLSPCLPLTHDSRRNFRLADLITVSNAVCGTLSIFFCIHYTSLTANLSTAPSAEAIRALYLAHLFPILGFGFDALDGRVARMTGGGSLLGQELDSLADLVRGLVFTHPSLLTKPLPIGLIRRRARHSCIHSRSPTPARRPLPPLLRLVRPRPPRTIQRNRRTHAQRWFRIRKVLYRYPYPLEFGIDGVHGELCQDGQVCRRQGLDHVGCQWSGKIGRSWCTCC